MADQTEPKLPESLGASFAHGMPSVEDCIVALVRALQDEKGWLHDYADAIVRDAIERKHLERTDKDCLTVVAWAYYDGERENFPSGPHATLLRSTALSFERHPHYRNETPLVRLTDAESALKARDAEIERLRGVLVETRRVLEQENNKGDASAIRDTIWRGLAETLFDYLDAAIDQARATGGEKAK